MKKGFIYTLEALVVIGVVFFSLFYLFRYAPQTPQTDIAVMKKYGIDALAYVDSTGELRSFVSQYNEAEIEKRLSQIMPGSVKFETEICGKLCSTVGVPTRQSVVTVDYYVSAYRNEYMGQRVRMWMWR
jgi:hypothetical protein